MPKAERKAQVVWEGNLFQGSGTITEVGSGALSGLPISWPARTESSNGKTSPEELLAAAHAGCYSMAFSNTLSKEGHTPERLTVNATATFEQVSGGFKITTIVLDVRGKVSGLDAASFAEIAQKAEQGCPVSSALRNNVNITVNAQLES